jgi:cytochrome c-type biogenesis protein CcmH
VTGALGPLLFWIVAAAMTAGVTALLLHPLLRETGVQAGRERFDRMVYRDQLTELDRDLARGLIDRDAAEAARAEIGRRLLATTSAPVAMAAGPTRGSRRLALALLVVIPVLALGLYLPTGRWDLPAQPFASREPDVPPAVHDALAKLEAHLRDHPDDIRSLALLGEADQRLGKPDQAAAALRQAAALAPDDPDIAGSLADILVSLDQGIVSAEARKAFETVIAHRPGDPRARFYLALAKAQAGDDPSALAEWSALAGDSPADAPWMAELQRHIAEAKRRLGP